MGGGGARGLAHVGVLKVLERGGIPIKAIAGTSMGGLIGAAYASGVQSDDLESEVRHMGQWNQLYKLGDLRMPRGGLLSGRRMQQYLDRRLGVLLSFDDLNIPLVLTAVDILTGRPVALHAGSVIDAMRATMSVPGVFTPVEIGEMRLVDGGVLVNVPAEEARRLGGDPVVAIDVMPCFCANTPGCEPAEKALELALLPVVARDLMVTQMIMVSTLTAQHLLEAKPAVVIRPKLPADITVMYGFHRAAECIAAGEAAAEAALPEIRAALASTTRDP